MEAPSAAVLKLQPINEILQTASPSTSPSAQVTLVNKLKTFCLSKLGVALLSTVAIFLTLVVLQPNYVFKKRTDDQSEKKLNWLLVGLVSLVGGLLVFFLPSLVERSCVGSE